MRKVEEKMTAQIGDVFKFNKRSYSIVAIEPSIKFNPMQYGIIPSSVCTACWSGYWCVYNITKKGIFLEDLYINSHNDEYPEINGVSVAKDNFEDKDFCYLGHHVYKGLHIKMDYTGRILVGDKFDHKYYIHMGYQNPWGYKILTEFVFEDGVLKETNDHSDVAEQIRNKLEEDGASKGRFFAGFLTMQSIKDCFSLDFKTKAWWLKP